MQSNDTTDNESITAGPRSKSTTSSQIVTADAVQAEEVPTVPLGPLQTLNTLQPEVTVHSVATTYSVTVPAPLVVQPSEYRRGIGEWFQVWWDGIRPSSIMLALTPVFLGTALAWIQSISLKKPFGNFHLTHFLATLAVVILLQVGAHLINDYYDYLKGTDTSNALGPGGLIQQGLIKPIRILAFGLTLLIAGGLIGLFVAYTGGPLLYLFGLAGLLCAYFYSATSRAISYILLGDLAIFCIFGPLLTLGAYMVQTGGHLDRSVFLFSVPVGLLATAVMHLNNMRDAESDAQAKKRTLANVLGLKLSRFLYILLLSGAYAIIIAAGIPHHAPHLVLITLWTLPALVVAITGVLRTDQPAALHTAMHQTLRLEISFTLLLILALAITTFWTILPHLPSIVLPI